MRKVSDTFNQRTNAISDFDSDFAAAVCVKVRFDVCVKELSCEKKTRNFVVYRIQLDDDV